MLKPYVHLMRRPGASAFFIAGILGRMPISMIGLGIVILIARRAARTAWPAPSPVSP